jgi:hypothetical protein
MPYEGQAVYEVTCQECGQVHIAEYSHEGRFNEGPIYAVVCTQDNLTDYYTSEVVRERINTNGA